MFCLKISVPWGMGVTPDQGAEMLHPVMYCCSPPQEGCIWDVVLLILFHAGKKKELMLMAWKFLVENVFPPAYIASSPVTPKSGGQFASLCVTVGLSWTWDRRLEHTAWRFCP